MRAMIWGELCVQNVFARIQELCDVNSVPVQPKLHHLTHDGNLLPIAS